MQNQALNATVIDSFSFIFEEELKKELTSVSKIYSVAAGEIIMDIGQECTSSA